MFRKTVLFICTFMLCFGVLWLSWGNYETKTKASTGTVSESKVTYSFDKKTGILTISGKGDMPADMQFRDNQKIKKVIVEEGVTSICDYAFIGCKKLKTLILPDGLLSIGVKSFVNTNIKKLTIPSSVRTIGQCAFWGCKSLKWITMPGDFKFVYEENEPDEWEFRIVSTFDFSGFAPKKITFTTPLNIENVSALSAKYLVVSEDDPLYSSINGVIFSKDGKELVRIPSERTTYRVPDGVEKIDINSFHYTWYLSDECDQFCSHLKKLYLPKGKCEILDEAGYIEPQAINVIANGTDLSGRDIELLTKYCFSPYINAVNEECRENPTKWFTEGFKGLIKLLDNGCVVTNDGLILRYFGEGGDVRLDSFITGIGAHAFDYYGVPREYDPEQPGQITSINIPDSVTYIGEYAFYDQYKLESIVIPSSVKEFGDYCLAFSGLKKIEFGEGIKEIPAKVCCSCGQLETVILPESLEKIGAAAFSHCISFDIDVYSGFETLPNLTEIGEMAFYNCKMKKFIIPEQITKIGEAAYFLNGDLGRNPEDAEIIVMGDVSKYEAGFCSGKAIPTFSKGIEGVKLGVQIRINSNVPDKDGKYLLGCSWQNIGGIDGYEYEASANEDFSGSAKLDTKESSGKVYIAAGSDKVKTLYAKVRAYKVIDDKGTREYSDWSYVSVDID